MKIKWTTLVLNLYSLAFGIGLFYPTVQLAIVAFTDDIRFPPRTFTLAGFRIYWTFWESLRFSLLLGAACVICLIPLCFLAAYVLQRVDFRGKRFVSILMFVPSIVPGTVIMTAIFVYYVTYFPFFMDSFIGILVANLVFNQIFMMRAILATLSTVDPVYEEAATAMGASRLQTFLKVTLPLVAPGLIAGSMVVFTNASTAFIAPLFLGRRLLTTTTVRIFLDVEEFGLTPYTAVQALITQAVVMGIVLTFFLVFRKQFRGIMF